MSVISKVADRRNLVGRLRRARKFVQAGDWAQAEIQLLVGRDYIRALVGDKITRRQFESCARMMCKHAALKEYTRTTWYGKGR